MTHTAQTPKAVSLLRSTARKARVALATALVAVGLVLPPLAAGLVAPPAYAASNTFTVNSASDFADVKVGDGLCDADFATGNLCTLRAAIQEANATTTETDTINFNIPEAFRDPSSGVATISPNSPLPAITDQATIDGYSQPGASPNTKTVGEDAALKIELDGTNVGNARGLTISNSSGSVIRGLVINRFRNAGIFISGDSVRNRIEGNFIGTDPTGTLDEGNQFDGVDIFEGPSENVVGGSTPDKRNVISGNDSTGVVLFDSNGNRIEGNYVGTDKSGTKDLGNEAGNGVFIQDVSGTTVGGKTAASRNLISGNGNRGLAIFGSQGIKVLGNRIGTTASGTGALGNDSNGVFIGTAVSSDSSNNSIGDGTSAGSNTIAFNGDDGVAVAGSTATGNEISRNSIFSNAGLDIDLMGSNEDLLTDFSNPNDAGDTDTGPNALQNKPVVTSAKTVSGLTTIGSRLNSHPNETYIIQFFSNPSGTDGGRKFIGAKSITTDKDGNRSFTFKPAGKVAVGRTITATATRDSTHDTSEFSAPRTVVSV